MKEEKSRVIRYADRREQISKMDDYSFETDVDASSSRGAGNTESTGSIDTLVAEYENYASIERKRDVRSRYHEKRTSHVTHISHISLSTIAWILVGILTVAMLVFIILILTGVVR